MSNVGKESLSASKESGRLSVRRMAPRELPHKKYMHGATSSYNFSGMFQSGLLQSGCSLQRRARRPGATQHKRLLRIAPVRVQRASLGSS